MNRLRQRLGFYLTRAVPIAIVGAFLGTVALALVQAAEPLLLPLRLIQGEARWVADGVLVGPYPRERDLLVLKHRLGVTEVVSLLDPRLPLEGRLLEKERRLVQALDLRFRSVPISYLKMDDAATRDQIRRLAAELKGRKPGSVVYVHCYLGRHRVGLLEQVLAPGRPPGGRAALRASLSSGVPASFRTSRPGWIRKLNQ